MFFFTCHKTINHHETFCCNFFEVQSFSLLYWLDYWRYRSRSKVVVCDTPSRIGKYLYQVWKRIPPVERQSWSGHDLVHRQTDLKNSNSPHPLDSWIDHLGFDLDLIHLPCYRTHPDITHPDNPHLGITRLGPNPPVPIKSKTINNQQERHSC